KAVMPSSGLSLRGAAGGALPGGTSAGAARAAGAGAGPPAPAALGAPPLHAPTPPGAAASASAAGGGRARRRPATGASPGKGRAGRQLAAGSLGPRLLLPFAFCRPPTSCTAVSRWMLAPTFGLLAACAASQDRPEPPSGAVDPGVHGLVTPGEPGYRRP